MAYDTFQRISLGPEVVRTDLEHHKDGSESVNQLWRKVDVQVEGVLVNLLTEFAARCSTSARTARPPFASSSTTPAGSSTSTRSRYHLP